MGDPVSQYFDVLAEPGQPDLLEAMWTHLGRSVRVDLIRFVKVRADATIAPLLAAKGFRITATEEAPFATLEGCADYAAFEARFSPKLRKNRRRQLRRLEERGPVEVFRYAGSAQGAEAALTTMRLKRIWLDSRGLVSRAFADRRFDAFFADVLGSSARPAGAHVSVLRSNGEPVDLNITVTAKGRLGLHILAYDQAVEKLGAGNHHLDVCLQRAFDEGIRIYDFLAPRHAYKMEWADGVVAVNDQAKALTWRGRLYLDIYVAGVREGGKALLKRLPRSVTRRLASLYRPSADRSAVD